MNAVIEEIYRTGVVQDSEGAVRSAFPTALRYEQGVSLYRMVRVLQPSHSLEVGMAYGLGSLFTCQGHIDNGGFGRHVAIDPFERSLYKSCGILNLRKAGLERFLEFYEEASHLVLPRLISEGRRFELAFIDGNHLFDYTMVDLFYVDKLLPVGGCLLLDDVWMPSVRKVLRFATRNLGYRLRPEFVVDGGSKWRRCFYALHGLIRDPVKRKVLRRVLRHAAEDPFDFRSLNSAIFLTLKGKLSYWVLEKTTEDERSWEHFRSF